MDDSLRELYQEVIMDHGRHPRNHQQMPDATASAKGYNPLCGDRVTVYVHLDDQGVIDRISFEGRGCAISQASASMLTETAVGRRPGEAVRLSGIFQAMCTDSDTNGAAANDDDREALERLQVLSGVKAFPTRVKCATLAWHAMEAALQGQEAATTE